MRKLTDATGRVRLLEPIDQELATRYRPVCRSLHGLATLDLSQAPRCGLQAVAEVVRSAPDLRRLCLCVPPVLSPGLWQSSTIPCLGLKHLTLSCSLKPMVPRLPGQPLDLEYVLENATSLDCTIVELNADLLPEDTVAVHLTCRAGSAVTCTIEEAFHRLHELRVVIEAAPGHLPARPALVSFYCNADRGWVTSIGYA